MSDAINPDHYKRLPAESIEIIESAIDNAPSKRAAYLHGQVLKYLLRCWNKNGIEDLRKAKWYLDRLIDSFKADETQKPDNTQTPKEHTLEKQRNPWTPKIGDWVRINKPDDTQSSAACWWPTMDNYDGQVIQVKKIEEDGVVHENWGFMFDWLEPAGQPKASLSSDKIPEGYRKLNDSSEEPRQLGDLRWSVSEKRYIEIGVDEIGYANRDNWAACRKIAVEVTVEVDPPDGWRWLEVGEVIRKGDLYRDGGNWWEFDSSIGEKVWGSCWPSIRRNRFEVGEKVVDLLKERVCIVKQSIGSVGNHCEYEVEMLKTKRTRYFFPHQLAPCIEE